VFASNYQPFGVNSGKSGSEEFLYTGKPSDDSTGLYYFGARHYLPEIGSFITEDTHPATLSDPQTLNVYAYCRNNPLKYVDPNGRWIETALDIVGFGLDLQAYNDDPSLFNAAMIGLDLVGMALPLVPAVGCIRFIDKADDVLDAVKVASKADDLVDIIETPEHLKRAEKFGGLLGMSDHARSIVKDAGAAINNGESGYEVLKRARDSSLCFAKISGKKGELVIVHNAERVGTYMDTSNVVRRIDRLIENGWDLVTSGVSLR